MAEPAVEEWSRFTATREDWERLIRTIAALANGSGGTIVLRQVDGPPEELDTARLDERVHRHVAPRVRGLASSVTDDGAIEIVVHESNAKPHVIQLERGADGASDTVLLHPGQIWVRHGSANAPATAEDLERMLRQRVAGALEELRLRVLRSDAPLALTGGDGIAVRISDEPGALSVVPDVERHYPYTARTLGEAVGRGQNWGSAAARALGLKGQAEFWLGIPGTKDYAVQRYSERALARVRERLARDPDWNPFAELRARRERVQGKPPPSGA
jgi:hypothetical protein